jgi:hypothetical protein
MQKVRVKKSYLNNRLHIFLLPFGTSGVKQDLHRTGTKDLQETHRHSKRQQKADQMRHFGETSDP